MFCRHLQPEAPIATSSPHGLEHVTLPACVLPATVPLPASPCWSIAPCAGATTGPLCPHDSMADTTDLNAASPSARRSFSVTHHPATRVRARKHLAPHLTPSAHPAGHQAPFSAPKPSAIHAPPQRSLPSAPKNHYPTSLSEAKFINKQQSALALGRGWIFGIVVKTLLGKTTSHTGMPELQSQNFRSSFLLMHSLGGSR